MSSKKTSRDFSRYTAVLTPVLGALLGVLIGSLVVVTRERSLFLVLGQMFHGAFGTWSNFSSSMVYAVPLGFTGLAVAFSYSAGVFNIGAEGQLQLAALSAAVVAVNPAFGFSPLVHVTLAILAGSAAGALWASVPGLLKAYKGFNEIVVTMLMNYIAILLVSYFLQGPMKNPSSYYPQTVRFQQTAWIQRIVPSLNLHWGAVIFLAAVAVVWFVLHKSVFGFQIRSVGFNPEGARYAGTNVKGIMLASMVVSGALAGLAGSVEAMGVYRRVMEGFSPGYGYDAIAVALLAGLNPIGIIFSSFFFGALRNAAGNLQVDFGIPISFIYIIQSSAIVFVISAQGFLNRFKMFMRRFKHAA